MWREGNISEAYRSRFATFEGIHSSISHSFDVQDQEEIFMNYKKFLGAASAALMIVIVITLALRRRVGAEQSSKRCTSSKVGRTEASP